MKGLRASKQRKLVSVGPIMNRNLLMLYRQDHYLLEIKRKSTRKGLLPPVFLIGVPGHGVKLSRRQQWEYRSGPSLIFLIVSVPDGRSSPRLQY